MAMYVIADLHLQTGEERLLQAFKVFTEQLQKGDELFILGDLFNFFVGVDSKDASHLWVRDTLSKATEKGIKVFFIRGNRDFLMTKQEAQWFHMELLPDFFLCTWGKHTVLLAHGDLFCTNDKAYMAYHKKVSQPWLQRLFRLTPFFVRRRIANTIREKSRKADAFRKDSVIYGVVEQSVAQHCQALYPQKKVEWVIHGHIHAFNLYMSDVPQFSWRYALGAWWTHFSFLRYDETQDMLDFRELPLAILLEEKHKQELHALLHQNEEPATPIK